MRTDLDELMDRAHAAEDDPVAENDMTGHLGIIAQDTIVPDDAVMSDMAIRQDHAIVADLCPPTVAGSAMYRDKFPNGRIITDLHRRLFAVELKVLRISRNNRTGKD